MFYLVHILLPPTQFSLAILFYGWKRESICLVYLCWKSTTAKFQIVSPL